ncbi:MAG: AMP-binding protein [Bifidobacteriaceae bacterium]|jgi:crotonobetaine/carnitine-CoA ligase|nr:AMP-binding protein [Bifidobacteriaceae bacterium]MCI1915085.1 AMP-binding protein [Bifidobacteriaceae bacterium]
MWNYQVSTRPEVTFLRFIVADSGEVSEYSYAEFDRMTTRSANLLMDRGVKKGDRVALQLNNSVEFVECLLALAKIGGICVPLNAANTASECKYMVDECDVDLLISDPQLYAEPGMSGLTDHVLLTDPDAGNGYQHLRDQEPNELKEVRDLTSDDLVEIMFTSGTTANPKGVMLTNANFLFSGWYVNWQLAMNREDRYFTTMAVTHANFQLSAMTPVITSGSTLILVNRYSATRFWREVRESDSTLVQSMAMIAKTTMVQPVDPHEKDHHVRYVHYFLPLKDEEKEAYERRFNVKIINNYGSSESLVGVITDLPFGPTNWPSIGRVGLGYEARIVDKHGQDVPTGTCGEILIKATPGVSLMKGYWRDEETTSSVLDSEDWYHTGDFGWRDESGWYYFAGRGVDLIKRAGENVSALCVEQVLVHAPGVEDAAVFGVPDDVRGEAVMAVIVPREGEHPTKKGIEEYASQHLAYFKVPSIIEFREDLPRGQYGKVLKNELREEAELTYGKE